MKKDELQCLFIGQHHSIYSDFLNLLKGFNYSFRFRYTNEKKATVSKALKKLSGASLVVISDEIPFSLALLSDQVWQNSSDSIILVLTRKTKNIVIRTPFNNTQFSKLNISNASREVLLHLQFLIHIALMKYEFRHCKSLLGISEKRSQWLIDSSREPVALISRDLHLYANSVYLNRFKINSIQQLRSVSIKDLILEDEHQIFDVFSKGQAKNTDINHSLSLSMKKRNGAIFRANIYLIPSVYKGRKCFQLWVRSLAETAKETNIDLLRNKDIALPEANPFGVVFAEDRNRDDIFSDNFEDKNEDEKEVMVNTYDTATILKGIIKRKEARISAHKLIDLRENNHRKVKYDSSYILSLRVSEAQKDGVNELLYNLPDNHTPRENSVFWDKVKLTRLLQILHQKKNINVNLFVRLSEASTQDELFIEWLLPGLRRIGIKAASLTFLLPTQMNDKQQRVIVYMVSQLRQLGCKVALDNYSVSKSSNALLQRVKPNYVRFSLPWTRQIQGHETREIGLSRVVRKLESNNIKVIAPCGYSLDMKKLFTMSGASFCQERTIKNV